MRKRFVAIWFRHLITDWFIIRQPALKNQPFVIAAPDHGRMLITAVSAAAQAQGLETGMALADARAMVPGLQVFDDQPELAQKLLLGLGKWTIRYTPSAAVDLPDGLLLDVTGCAHLWGGELPYLQEIIARLNAFGYGVGAAMADSIGAAWAIARYGKTGAVVGSEEQTAVILSLPPAALRLEMQVLSLLQKLGLHQVSSFAAMPRSALRRRFGPALLNRLDQALGREEEMILPIEVIPPYQERLPCLEPILTATGIEIALQRLLETLCKRLQQEGKGFRTALLKAYRVDGKVEEVSIGTNRASHNEVHLFRLFEDKLRSIEPALGIELFVLEATKADDVAAAQETLWTSGCRMDSISFAELVDRLTNKIGANAIRRYLPEQHYWPERSFKAAACLQEKTTTAWRNEKPRPMQLLPVPEPIEVSAPIPDYPPMLFRYQGKLHRIKKADGPERIEREWWLDEGLHRDYYAVEDEAGQRYWLFRSGHYDEDNYRWFIHGFFA
ncbi:Y-family DNA polymerase [Chitinophaga sp. 22321]|uniref:DNA polymerase Y family protein n=1 Tax=Chitinophaga hostae TaxID=2831022 RepID=A0ABS5J4A6_9BACT|nr:DNA polymerase Y family protein [Chitinophaga hostae]MBS0030054.1 DNA polymerase Y family protein [Chitinophaga hostae]